MGNTQNQAMLDNNIYRQARFRNMESTRMPQTVSGKNHAAWIFTQGLVNNADRLDELQSVHRLLDGVEVERRAPRRQLFGLRSVS
jgi:hypothetical protein